MAAPASSTPGAYSRRFTAGLRVLCAGLFLLANAPDIFAFRWDPVDPAELATAKPQVDPEAGAELLFREVTVDHANVDEFVITHHVRAKIFSERGLSDFTLIEIPYERGEKIRDVEVRTIRPNGEIIELTKKDIYDREVRKKGKERTRVKSFSPAGLEPGAIVEYTYTKIDEDWSWWVTLLFQSEQPARHVRLKFRAVDFSKLSYIDAARLSARALFFNCPQQPMEPDAGRFYVFEMRDVPAARDEPFQPPHLNNQSSVLICYSVERDLEPAAYWARQGKELNDRMKRETKDTKLVRQTLASIIAPDDSDEEKLRKIYDYCVGKLINRSADTATFTRDEREKFKANETATDTLKAGHGTGEDINAAFVALARAAGLDARYAMSNDRAFLFFNASLTEPLMAPDLIAAVLLNDEWRYFDPGVRYLPFAMPYWTNAATVAIPAAPKNAAPLAVDASPAEQSLQKRSALLQLDADGTLEGSVTVEYTGHQELFQKRSLDAKSVSEREASIREDIQTHLKLAEITDIKVENADNPLARLKISFHLRVPEYADRTGSRLFFQPAVFQKNVPPLFTEATRRTAIIFPFCYVDTDNIRIVPPAGFELEEASSPGSIPLGGLGNYEVSVGYNKTTRTIVYQRSFALRSVSFRQDMYPAIRQAFEVIHKRDAHTFTLRRIETPAAATAPGAATTAAAATTTATGM